MGDESSCVMSMRALSTSSRGPVTLLPYRYGHYRPAKKRWWPLFALLGALGACVLAMLPTPQQSDDARSTQKPLVYSVIGSGALANANPAVKEPAPAPVILNEPADDPPLARDATAPTKKRESGIRPGPAHRRTVTRTRAEKKMFIAEKFSATDATAGILGDAILASTPLGVRDHRKVSRSTPRMMAGLTGIVHHR